MKVSGGASEAFRIPHTLCLLLLNVSIVQVLFKSRRVVVDVFDDDLDPQPVTLVIGALGHKPQLQTKSRQREITNI